MAAGGLLWTFLSRFGQLLVQFIIGLILARWLGPNEYGLVAMLSLFLALANLFADGGFGKALIQKQETDDLDASSMFYFNLLAAAVCYGLIWLIAPSVSQFYQRVELTNLLRMLGIAVFASAFGTVQSCLMTKRLQFRSLLIANWIATLGSGTLGLVLAFQGFGAWSLIGQQVVLQALRSMVLWILSTWRPKMAFSGQRLLVLLPYGSRLFLANSIDAIFQHLYAAVIGKVYTAEEVGFYHRAHSLQQLPVGNYLTAVNQVSFPLLSRIKDQPSQVQRVIRKSISFGTMSIGFLMCFLVAAAEPLTEVLLGTKWLPSAPYLQILCISGIIIALQAVNESAFQALGHSDLVLRFHLIRKSVVAVLLALTIFHGVTAILWGQVVALVINFSVCGFYSHRLFGYGTWKQVCDAFPYLALSVFATVIGWLAVVSWPMNVFVELLIQTVVSVGVYVGLHFWLRMDSFREVIQVVGPQLKRFKFIRS